jgi:hypothetical protein
MISSTFQTENPDPVIFLSYFKFLPILLIVIMAIYFGWFWSVGVKLQEKLPSNVNMKIKNFKIFVLIPFIYMILFSLVMVYAFSTIPDQQDSRTSFAMFRYIAAIIPIHLFSMFCIFYCVYFTAKTIKSVELQREALFNDYIGEFFMIWFFPIGVWILQPRINTIMKSEFNKESHSDVVDKELI